MRRHACTLWLPGLCFCIPPAVMLGLQSLLHNPPQPGAPPPRHSQLLLLLLRPSPHPRPLTCTSPRSLSYSPWIRRHLMLVLDALLPPTHTNNKPLQHLPHHWIPMPHTQRHLRHLSPQMTLNNLFLGGRRQGWLPRFASEALVLAAVRSHRHPPGHRSPLSSTA